MKKVIISLFFGILSCVLLTQSAMAFTDMDSTNWAYPYVTYLEQRGVVFGYPDGTFRPDDFATKAEFTSMAVRALKLIDKPVEEVYQWLDVTPEHWAYPYIELAANYDLVEANPNGYFRPDDTVKRAHVIEIITNALDITELTTEQARALLSGFKDVDEIPGWALKRTAQAEKLGMLIIPPFDDGYVSALRPATRGELAGFLVKMMQQAAISPNKKIGEARMTDGYIIENAYIDNNIAYIPAGTVLPLAVMKCMSSKKRTDEPTLATVGDHFEARATKNFVDKNKVLIIPVGTTFEGTVQKVVREKTFVQNGDIVLSLETMKRLHTGEVAEFPAVSDSQAIFKHPKTTNTWKMNNFLDKVAYNVFKGQNAWVHMGQLKGFVLLKPIEIDTRTNWIPE